jgi:hypothetical protein
MNWKFAGIGPATKDFTLAPGSGCINAANPSLYGLPGRLQK